jgi:LacI family transcriptional regulator, galactose operon repressor
MAVTVKDVAQDAGVSQATAARVLGQYGYASMDARRRVRDSAARLGYTPNGVARALVSRSTKTVGLVVGDIDNPFFAAVARGLSDVLEPHGHTVLLANADEDPARERRAMQALRSRQVDGLVVVPAPGAAAEAFRGGPPLVQLDRAVRGLDADAVMVRNGAGAAAAVDHLARLGHTRIGMVCDSPSISSSAERLAGYRRALRGRGLLDESLVSIGGSSQAEGHRAALALLGRPDRPSAVFTANNFMTHGTLLAARELGIRIPADLALVGFDDLDWTTLIDPPLTVVSQPVSELGRLAGQRLLARLRGDDGPARRIRLDTRLVVRGSCGAAA